MASSIRKSKCYLRKHSSTPIVEESDIHTLASLSPPSAVPLPETHKADAVQVAVRAWISENGLASPIMWKPAQIS